MNSNEENNLRKRMQEYASPLDFDAEWEALSGRLNKERDRKKLFLFIMISFMVSITSVLIYSSMQINQIVSADKKGLVSVECKNDNIDLNLLGKTQELANTNNLHAGLSTSKNLSTKSLVNEAKQHNSKGLKPNNNKVIRQHARDQSVQNILNNTLRTHGSHSTNNSAEQLTINHLTNQNDKLGSHVFSSVIEDTAFSSPAWLSMQTIPAITLKGLKYDKREVDLPTSISMESSIHSSNKKAYQLYGAFGLMHSSQTFKATSDESEALRMLRQSTEQPLETYYADFGIRYAIAENFFIYGGMSYTQAHDKLTYLESNEHNYTLENVLTKVIDFRNNEALEIYTDEEVTGTRTTSYNNYNRYISYCGSVGLGKNIIQAKKLRLAISLGLGWNISSNVQGLTTNISQGVIKVVKANEVYKNSFGLSAEGALHLIYPLSTQLSIEFRPMLRYYNSPITQSDYELTSSLYRVGGVIGITHRLNQ